MATTLTVNGTGFSYPDAGDENWAAGASGWASAVTSGMLQKAGGSFVLTADVDFGANFGLKSIYYKSRGTAATAGVVRLANAETISWRNAANSANAGLFLNSSDIIVAEATLQTSGQYLAGNGSVGAPAFTFISDGDSGLFRIGANDIALSAGGATVCEITPSQVSFSQQARAINGSASIPSYAFNNDINSGFYRVSSHRMMFSANGADILQIDEILGTSAITVLSTSDGSASAPSLTFNSDRNTGFFRVGTDTCAISAGGTTVLTIDDGSSVAAGGGSTVTTRQNGFLYVPTSTGTPTGVPDHSYTGLVPMVVDTSGNKVYFYTGGTWKGVTIS